jgi:AraC family transcriptional regulator of adaptative response/methylated-DNA-[protein]-cysteine methyltransferase
MSISANKAALATAIASDARWASVVARGPQADGQFYYSVKTTGVYRRPSCAARRARPEHVRFHATCHEAEQAGFRACKRCRPEQASRGQQHAATIAQACRLIEELEEVPSLERLAHQAGLSMSHFHRLFKATTGLTPREYAAAH